MEINILTILVLVSVAAISIRLLQFFRDTIKNREWLILGVALIIIGTIVWLITRFYQDRLSSDGKGESKDFEETLEEIEKQVENQPGGNSSHSLKEDRIFFRRPVYLSEVQEDSEEESLVNYDEFKKYIGKDSFIKEFTESLRKNYQAKKIAYAKFYRKISLQMKSIKSKGQTNNVLNPDTENLRVFENTLEEIKEIIFEIKKREEELNEEKVKENLREAVYNAEEGIESLIDRMEIKNYLATNLHTFSCNHRIFFSSFQNIRLYGDSGYGKTTIARVIAFVYSKAGIFIRNRCLEINKSMLTTALVDESGKKTYQVLLSGLESIIFHDEAYEIVPEKSLLSSYDHGFEAITTIITFTGDTMGLCLYIAAGYRNEMEKRFMASNQGIPRRFPVEIELEPYSSSGLSKILIRTLIRTNPDLKLKQDEKDYIFSIIETLNYNEINIFPRQGGDIINLAGTISKIYYSQLGETSFSTAIRRGFNKYLAKHKLSIREDE